MPVRSWSSPVLVWPDAAAVDRAARQWAEQAALARPDVLRIGYFGSYARGDWGVGSDLDLIVVLERSAEAFERRPLGFDATTLPVPADVLVYTAAEWESLAAESPFGRRVDNEAVWVYRRPGQSPAPSQPGAIN
jgi:predicted nucleotidyltransferase